jgi:hypothetical protein
MDVLTAELREFLDTHPVGMLHTTAPTVPPASRLCTSHATANVR